MAASGDNKTVIKPSKSMTQEQILGGFDDLRNSQRITISKIAEFDMEKKEHDLVIETLKKIDGERKCFRLVGGVLVERTVKDVLPSLVHNSQQLSKISEGYQKQLETKSKELILYKEKHNIRIKGEAEKVYSLDKQNQASSVTPVLVEKTNSL